MTTQIPLTTFLLQKGELFQGLKYQPTASGHKNSGFLNYINSDHGFRFHRSIVRLDPKKDDIYF